ncbi:hypothetical protein ACQY1Q_04255 [Tenacibaculum sp. TC6]|uniref:hypothetical protein n=1 Tax=Tenacibaculum sp. TC6 TaxID=3423223 RepID=UPI003D367C6E
MIANRIKQLIEYKKVTVSEFAEYINIEEKELKEALDSVSQINSEWLKSILKVYPEVNAEWLLLGVGDILYNVQDKRYVINLESLRPEEILDYILINPDKFREESKLDAVVALFSNFEQQRELQKMYDKIERYEKLLEEKVRDNR